MSADKEFKDLQPHHHVMPLKIYFGVFGALLVLTALTVIVSQLDLGIFAIYAAMTVALIKGGFVVGYFMHLKFDTKFHQLVFFASLFFLVVFFVFTFLDLSNRGLVIPEQGNRVLARDRASVLLAAHRQAIAEQEKALRAVFDRPVKPEEIAKAAQIYQKRCASCHGKGGKGNGTASAALNPPPRDYTDTTWQARVTDYHIARVILKGGIGTGFSPTMPPHPDLRKSIHGMVGFIRSLAGIDRTKPIPKPAAATGTDKTSGADQANPKPPAGANTPPAATTKPSESPRPPAR